MSSCHTKKDDHCKPRKKKHCHPHHESHCHPKRKPHCPPPFHHGPVFGGGIQHGGGFPRD